METCGIVCQSICLCINSESLLGVFCLWNGIKTPTMYKTTLTKKVLKATLYAIAILGATAAVIFTGPCGALVIGIISGALKILGVLMDQIGGVSDGDATEEREAFVGQASHLGHSVSDMLASVSIFTAAAAAASGQGGGGYSVKPNIKMVNSNSYTKSSRKMAKSSRKMAKSSRKMAKSSRKVVKRTMKRTSINRKNRRNIKRTSRR